MKRPLMYAAGGFVLGEVCLLLPMWLGAGILVILTAGVCYLWNQSGRSLLWWGLPLFCVLGMLRLKADGASWHENQQLMLRAEDLEVRLEGDVSEVAEKEKSIQLELEKVKVYVEGKEFDFSDVLVYVKKETSETYEAEVERESMAEAERESMAEAERGSVAEVVRESVAEAERGSSADAVRELRMGMRISVWGQLEPFEHASNPGQFDFADYYHSLGFDGRMYGEFLRIVNDSYSPYYQFLAQWKQQAAQTLEQICTTDDIGIFQAVLLGEKSELAEDIQELYQRNGIAHLLAVSGLHVSLIGLGCYHLLRRLGLGFDGAGFAAALVTISYGVLTGGAASVVRAVTMVLFQLAADKLGRTYDLLSAMAFAAITLLAESPTLLFQAGFQLSFGAILAIGAVNPVLTEWLHSECRWEKTLVLSLTIQLVTYPMISYHFFEYPVYGVILNLLVVPLMSYVVVSGLAGVGLGMWWISGGTFAIGTGHYVLAAYEWLCRSFERLPGAVWIVGRPRLWQIAVYGAGWTLVLIWMHRGSKKEAPKRAVFLMLLLLSFMSLRPYGPAGLEATFLDVGQGDGTLLQTRNVVILADGGSSDEKQVGEQVLEPCLKSKGISRIDYAVVSHGDKDHISGLVHLFQSCQDIEIEYLILPWLGKEDAAYEELQKLAAAAGTKVLWMRTGSQIQRGELLVRCLYAGEGLDSQERNDHSPLVEVTYGSGSILLTGDMSAEGERQWLKQAEMHDVQGKLRILKVAHHGSRYSTSEEFLRKVQPKAAVISCGAENSYGHPHEETLERLEDAGSAVLVTKERGAVIVELGKTAKVYGFGGK